VFSKDMAKSNAPLALSVASLTVPDDIEQTFRNITQFDDLDFGFNHNQTWAALPFALRGVLSPEAVTKSFVKAPVRVQRCITALCELGRLMPRATMRFEDFPEAGVRTVASIDWDPEIRVRVKATCWYMVGDQIVIPVLQPRKIALSPERLALYQRLVMQAYCQGDWINARTEIIDLSGSGETVIATPLRASDIPVIDESRVARYVQTFVAAKKHADKIRGSKAKVKKVVPMGVLLGLDD
jgi:hypothetical protein